MSLTGRAALVALTGTLAALLLRSWAGLLTVDGLIGAAVVADVWLAARLKEVAITRSADARILLGQRGVSALTISNAGRRQFRGIVRDAWQPSMQAAGRSRVSIPPGGQVTVTTSLVPARRGDKQAGQVTVRSVGPLGLAAR